MLDHTAKARLKRISDVKTVMKQEGCTTACACATWAEAAKRAQTRAVLANMAKNAVVTFVSSVGWL